LLISGDQMRIAAILGLGSSTKHLHSFARNSDALWRLGLPDSVGEADAILILGGDGTIHRHLAQMTRLQLPVLVVPCGSGNDFARSLNLHRVRDSMAAWEKFCAGGGNVLAIDLGVITPLAPPGINPSSASPFLSNADGGASVKESSAAAHDSVSRYFCCVGGVGLDAEIARRANQLTRWIRRRGGYALSLLPALLGFQAPRVKTQSDLPGSSSLLAARHDGPAMVVAFANAPTYGDGIRIAPHAKLDDGKLDICVVGAMNKMRLLRLFPSVYSGSHLSVPEVKYFQTEHLRVETDRPMDVYADGEYVCRTPVEVSVERAALRVIIGGEQAG
jgi:diacylglycerol kinase (ATP)